MGTMIDADDDCPHDPRFEHRFWYGCVPRTFSDRTGRAKGFHQTETPNAYPQPGKADTRWLWDGGCDKHFQALHEARGA